MNLASSFRLIRTAATASSSRTLARPATRLLAGRRLYSTAEQPKESTSDKKEDTSEKKEENPCEAKLKAKEEEAADLKVRCVFPH